MGSNNILNNQQNHQQKVSNKALPPSIAPNSPNWRNRTTQQFFDNLLSVFFGWLFFFRLLWGANYRSEAFLNSFVCTHPSFEKRIKLFRRLNKKLVGGGVEKKEGVSGGGGEKKYCLFTEDLEKQYDALLNRDQKVGISPHVLLPLQFPQRFLLTFVPFFLLFYSLSLQPDSGLDCYYSSAFISSLLGRLPC